MTINEFIQAVQNNEPIALTDDELWDLAETALDELCARMPRYAFDQGDLSYDDGHAVAMMEAAEEAAIAVRELRVNW